MYGVQFVMIPGTQMMLLLFVTNWDFQDLVNFHCVVINSLPLVLLLMSCLINIGASAQCCAIGGPGSGPIHMTNVRCTGNELSLTDCPHSTNNNCNHGEDASVQCQTSEGPDNRFNLCMLICEVCAHMKELCAMMVM